MSNLLAMLQTNRRNVAAARDAILDNTKPEDFSPELQNRAKDLDNNVRALDARIAEVQGQEDAEKRAGRISGAREVRQTAGGVPVRVQVSSEPEVYYRGGNDSFFADLLAVSTRQDREAAERLARNQTAQNRALSTLTTAGGTFAPPLWLVDEYVRLARPGRVTADLLTKAELPEGVSSINLPAVATGTTVGITQTQNTAVSNTDITTSSVSSGITTISGQQVLSLELLRQSGAAIDQIVLQDLALAASALLDVQVLAGTGSNGQLLGINQVTGRTSVAFTTTTPSLTTATAANSLYYAVVKAANAIATNRYLPADAIVMHPRRWAWISTQLDTTNRPIVAASESGQQFNSAGSAEAVVAGGRVGTLAGLPVYVDPNIATNLGAGTNQDQVIVMRAADLWLWESVLSLQTFEATYAAQNSLLVRALSFAAHIPHRYPKSIATIDGTGLVDPGL